MVDSTRSGYVPTLSPSNVNGENKMTKKPVTKTRFKQEMDCPTKRYYSDNAQMRICSTQDDALGSVLVIRDFSRQW